MEKNSKLRHWKPFQGRGGEASAIDADGRKNKHTTHVVYMNNAAGELETRINRRTCARNTAFSAY